ncbi:hypothetical protein ACQ9ZF_05105 [Cetobacterium somerae]|uniref:hypothetical protein n=1 Tax=Cetobacterium somerae TaxID=188913 RepID=UPI003D767F08
MALNAQQIAWLGIYNDLPMTVTTFFLRRIARGKIPYVVNTKSIDYEEVKKHAIKAKILKRGEKFPTSRLNGSVIKGVTPEVIKDSIPFTPYDALNRLPGQEVYINGKKVDHKKYEEDKRIASLKVSVPVVQEEIAAGVFLEGKYVSPDTGNEVTYTAYPSESVAVTDIKEWGIWTTTKINEFITENKVRVDEILVGKDVFYKILTDYNKSSNKVITATPKRVQTQDGDYELHLDVFGFNYVMIPDTTDTQGNAIDTANWFQLRNDAAVIPAFAGVVNVVNGQSTLEAADLIIRETPADPETGEAKTLAESAYCPIVVNPNIVKTYKVTGL